MNHLLVQSDARRIPLADGSVHCIVTSPPYFALRDYGTATWEGGEPECDHLAGPLVSSKSGLRNDGREHIGPYDGEKAVTGGMPYRDVCGKCGARRIDAQLGLEPTSEAYVAKMVAVFREVKRVLRDDGTCWVNLGDSYASSGGRQSGSGDTERGQLSKPHETINGRSPLTITSLSPKNLIGIPWRVAFALQADGWYLRSDIIWHKPNPMPESATDRPTKSHEYVFLLAKNERYFFDAEAVKEDTPPVAPRQFGNKNAAARLVNELTGNMREGVKWESEGGRNIRSVWQIPTEPYPGAHFATFPRKLVMPCIKAGTSQRGVCPICSAPWERVTEKEPNPTYGYRKPTESRDKTKLDMGQIWNSERRTYSGTVAVQTLGWRPTCSHDAEPVPATVFDPFNGSGTTGVVALALKRNYIGCDLSADYLKQAERRISRPHARVERASKPEPMPLFAGLEP